MLSVLLGLIEWLIMFLGTGCLLLGSWIWTISALKSVEQNAGVTKTMLQDMTNSSIAKAHMVGLPWSKETILAKPKVTPMSSQSGGAALLTGAMPMCVEQFNP